MFDQASRLRERVQPRGRIGEVWAVVTLGGERHALAFAREIREVLRPGRLRVGILGEPVENAQIVLLPAGEGVQGVRRAYMRGAHTWLILCPAAEDGLLECLQLLQDLTDRSVRSVYLALSGVDSVPRGEAAVRRFAEWVGQKLPLDPQPFGFYGPDERGTLTLAPAVLRRFYAAGRRG